MGDDRPPRRVHRLLDDLHEQTEDEPIPGGCERCNAYQTVEKVEDAMYALVVHHDAWCSFLRAREARAN